MPFTVLQTVPPEPLKVEAFTLMVTITTAPTLRFPSAQLTVPPLCVQVPCVVETFAKVTSVGNGSETVTPVATAGPLFVTCSVYVRLVFWSTGSGVAVFTMDTSACVGDATTVEDVAELFAKLGSFAVGPMLPVLEMTVPGASVEVALTTSGKLAVPPTASGPVHVTVPPLPTAGVEHDQPEGVAKETKVEPAGMLSV